MSTILVSSACGFLGSNIIRKLLYNHPEFKIIGLDDLSEYTAIKNIYYHRNHNFHPGFIENKEWLSLIDKLYQPEVCLNFIEDNGYSLPGFAQIFNTRELDNVKYIINVRTNCNIFGMIDDRLCQYKKNCTVVNLNVSSVFGPRQSLTDLIPRVIKSVALKEKATLPFTPNHNLSWIYINDLISIVDKCLINKIEGSYFVNSNFLLTPIEMIQRVCNLLGSGHDLFSWENESLLFQENKLLEKFEFNYSNFSKSLEDTVNWYIHNSWYLRSS